MAVVVTRTVVCDEDRKETEDLVKVQLVVDGKRASQVLCPRHAAPYQKLLEKMGGRAPADKGRIYTPEEIAARKRVTKKR
jgi:hypothetical protein